jgi:hypothetical protein
MTPPAQMHANNQATYRDVVQDAATGGASLMGKLVSSARLALQTREAASRDMRERDQLTESAKLLRMHEAALCKKYPEALLDAFSNPEGVKKATAVAIADLQFDQLELMDEVTVMTSVALARTQQVAVLASEASLSDLNTLICSLLGLGAVRPERNPLRPEIYVKALKETIESTKVPSAIQLDWISCMSATLGQELRTLYVGLCKKLRADGVVSASFAVTQTVTALGVGRGVAQDAMRLSTVAPENANSAPMAQGVMSSGVPIRAAESNSQQAFAPGLQSMGEPAIQSQSSGERALGREEALLTLDKLRRLLSGELGSHTPMNRVEQFAAQFEQQFEGGPSAAQFSAANRQTEFDATVPAALEALTEMRQVERVVQSIEQRRNLAQGTPLPQSVDATRSALRHNVRDIAQALSLEVVTLMVDNIARDPRLLEPLQQLVRSLEPALLRLALVDPRFFTDKQHCARRLLQDITHSSLAFNAVTAEGFDVYFQGLQDTLAPLLTANIESAEPFERTLAVLQEGWGRIERLKEKDREVAVEVLKHAEARNLLAEKIARGIEAHPDSKRVPPVVIDFLCGPWAQVVAQARIKGGAGSAAADKYQALITAMLWSAHPEMARESVSKLTRLVPKLLTTLREGLDTIRYPATKTSAFLESLMAIHQVAFRSTSETPVPADPLPAQTESPQRVEQGDPWIAPEEVNTSNLMEIREEPADAPAGSDAPSAEVEASAVTAETIQVDGELPLGAWVELQTNGQWVRTQLTWASPHGTLFLFTSAFGTIQSMTRRSRDKLIEAGRLRVISGHAVVEVALDGVAQAAMRNSVDIGP